MEAAFYLLLVAGHLGFFDVLYFHWWRCRLGERPECRREVRLHTARHLVYGLQFLWVANLRFHGAALLLLVVLYAGDIYIAWADVWEETRSRASMGGLPRGEYFMHIVLSVLVGAYLCRVVGAVWNDRLLTAAIVLQPPDVPFVLRVYLSAMGVAALGFFVREL
jgi:hypothetical protein